jgi:Phosphotransferase system, mannose/fructose-specific component IIA
MLSVIIVTHGDLASSLIKTSRMIVGKQEGVFAVELKEGDSVEELGKRIREFLNANEEAIILTDLFGASPTNASTALLKEYLIEIVTGVNLPMLLDLLMDRDASCRDIAKRIKERGKESIVNIREKL